MALATLGQVSLAELDTIENVSVAYLKLITKHFSFFFWFSHLYSMQTFSAGLGVRRL